MSCMIFLIAPCSFMRFTSSNIYKFTRTINCSSCVSLSATISSCVAPTSASRVSRPATKTSSRVTPTKTLLVFFQHCLFVPWVTNFAEFLFFDFLFLTVQLIFLEFVLEVLTGMILSYDSLKLSFHFKHIKSRDLLSIFSNL